MNENETIIWGGGFIVLFFMLMITLEMWDKLISKKIPAYYLIHRMMSKLAWSCLWIGMFILFLKMLFY